jgi:hypothetical protein
MICIFFVFEKKINIIDEQLRSYLIDIIDEQLRSYLTKADKNSGCFKQLTVVVYFI